MCSASQELCSAVGPVENVQMPVLGEAEVTFRYKDDALEAYRKYNQRNLDGMRHLVCKQKIWLLHKILDICFYECPLALSSRTFFAGKVFDASNDSHNG